MPSTPPISVWLAPGVPEAIGVAVLGAPTLQAAPDHRADVVVAPSDRPPPTLRPDGPALVALGDPRTASARWLEVEVDAWCSPVAFGRAPERVVIRALAARTALRIGPTERDRAWLDAVRLLTGADAVGRVWPEDVEWSGDDETLAQALAPVSAAARSGTIVIPSLTALRERFAIATVAVDGLVAMPLGARAADGVLVALVRAGGADWVREAVPTLRGVAHAAQREGLVRRLVAAETGRRWVEKLLHRVLSVVSHDLRNPLFAVQLGLKVLEREHGRTEQIATIHRTVGTATQLLRKLVDAGRQVLELPSVPPPTPSSDLGEVFRRALETALRNQPTSRAVVGAPADGTAVRVEPVSLERVLATLLENALQHATGDEPVTVRVESAGPEIRLEIRNPGRLPFVDSERIEPFEHRAKGGLGVGLYAARRLAAANGVQLRVRQDGATVEAQVVMPRAVEATPVVA